MTAPTIGRIVHYTLSAQDAEAINRRRDDFDAFRRMTTGPIRPGMPGRTGHQAHVGNRAEAGQVYPAIVVRTWESSFNSVNLHVLLDGNDTYWAPSKSEGSGDGTWCWPPRV